MSDSDVRRLMAWNRFWLTLLIVVVLAWAASAQMKRLSDRHRVRVTAQWGDNGLVLRPSSDGPFVVTCLVYGVGTAAVRHAVLPEPLVVIDSGGAAIESEALRKLTWRDWMGRTDAAPPDGTPMKALYYRPLETTPPGSLDP